jgi:hypothetical protein
MLDDWRDLPEVLMPDDNSLRILASCYLVCKSRFLEISNTMPTDPASYARYVELQKQFLDILVGDNDASAPLLHRDA